MINSVIVANHRGDVLFTRNTRGPVSYVLADLIFFQIFFLTVRQNTGEVFRNSVVLSGECKTPVVTINSLTYCYIKENEIFLVATTDCNSDILGEIKTSFLFPRTNTLVIFAFLFKFSNILQCYLSKFDQKHISSKLYLVHEILDGIFPFFFPLFDLM